MSPTSSGWIPLESTGMVLPLEKHFTSAKLSDWTGMNSSWNGLEFGFQLDSSLVQV